MHRNPGVHVAPLRASGLLAALAALCASAAAPAPAGAVPDARSTSSAAPASSVGGAGGIGAAGQITPSAAASAPLQPSSEQPATYVNGISDENIPWWSAGEAPSFRAFFESTWVAGRSPGGRIQYARLFYQWSLMREGSRRSSCAETSRPIDPREELEGWICTASAMGLGLELAPTELADPRSRGRYPRSAAEYGEALAAVLARARVLGAPIAYVEAWNEPNSQGDEPPATAAAFFEEAARLCTGGYGCAAVAGNLVDVGAWRRYERDYVRALSVGPDPRPAEWGVHPYIAVLRHDPASLREYVRLLPAEGRGATLSFTEVGAATCEAWEGRVVRRSPLEQAEDAAFLVGRLLPLFQPRRVFYYFFLRLPTEAQPACTQAAHSALAAQAETAIYAAAPSRAGPIVARSLAAVVYGDPYAGPLAPVPATDLAGLIAEAARLRTLSVDIPVI